MTLLSSDTSLGDVIFRDISVIPVLQRFGIFPGVGRETVGGACRRLGIDTRLLLSVLNTFMNEDYFPEDAGLMPDISGIVAYMEQTDRYYSDVQLPNIERHFNSLITRSSDVSGSGNLHMLRGFFIELKSELSASIEADMKRWFPMLLGRAGREGCGSADEIMAGHLGVEEKLNDLAAFFVIHLRGECDRNLCMAVISAIFTLRKDIRQNNRIRQRLILPAMRTLMEKSGPER